MKKLLKNPLFYVILVVVVFGLIKIMITMFAVGEMVE